MLTITQWASIDEYLKLGVLPAEIAKRVKVSKPTVYKRIKTVQQGDGPRVEADSEKENKFSKHIPCIKAALKRNITSNEVIHTILQEETGYPYSYATTTRLVKSVKFRMKKHYKPSKKHDTGPGEEAQVDWGYYGEVFVHGKKRRVWFFVYILGYSRCTYVEFTVNQNRKTLKQCHINAFKKLGIPRRVLYDNMKTVVKERGKINGEKYIKLSPEFLDFAQCLGFEIVVCTPHHPRSKGKVERAVRSIKTNFVPRFRYRYKKKSEVTLDLLNQEITKWVQERHEKIHDETHQKPNVLWRTEKRSLHFMDETKLTPLLPPIVARKISKDGYLSYKNLPRFQLAQNYIEEWVDVKEVNEHGLDYVEVYFKNKVIGKFTLSTESEHINLIADKDAKLRKDKAKWNKKLDQLKSRSTRNIPEYGFYRPEGYYRKYTSYRA